jgi:hypothetical protein
MLPKAFGAGIQGATCAASGELPSRTQCTVVCQPNYVIANGLTADDFVYACVKGRLILPAASCRLESNGFEPKIVGHVLLMSLAGQLANFGAAERSRLALHIANKLGVTADSDLEFTFRSGSVVIRVVVRGETGAQPIANTAVELMVDGSWPLGSFPVVSARYDGPVLEEKPNSIYCRMILAPCPCTLRPSWARTHPATHALFMYFLIPV